MSRLGLGFDEKDGHSALLKLRSASLTKLSADEVGFVSKVGTVRFYPKVARKLPLSADTKQKV